MRLTAPTAPLPCSAEPERWFDRAHRTHALSTCLECPVRRWCAQEALRARAPWGMWAGIWIDGTFGVVPDLLQPIAADATISRPNSGKPSVATQSEVKRLPLRRLRTAPAVRPGSVNTAVVARSSGQCEI